jgi:hypothetical protein
MGGSPAPGLALGGALTLSSVKNDDSRLDDVQSSADAESSLAALGFFVDGFPNPRGGFHLGGSLGLAAISASSKSELTQNFDGGGFSMSTWAGYDWWVGREWSLGAALRLLGAFAREEKSELTLQGSYANVSLMFTALYH